MDTVVVVEPDLDWPSQFAEYAALKRTLASAHRDDREGYVDGKSQFIARVLARARCRSDPSAADGPI